jgi:hypothetical protein
MRKLSEHTMDGMSDLESLKIDDDDDSSFEGNCMQIEESSNFKA